MLNTQQRLHCCEHHVFHLFRWLMSAPLQCGLQRKLSVSLLSIHYNHLTPSSILSLKLINYGLCPMLWMVCMQLTECTYCMEACRVLVVHWDESLPRTVETHPLHTSFFVSEGHMFDFISTAAAVLGRNCNLLIPPQILTFPICCVVLQQIEPTRLREC